MAAMMTNDRALVDQVSRMDNGVDGLDEAIKLYVTKLTRGSLDEREGKRAMEIISFAINLEHIGDIIDKNLSELATKKIKRRFQFSPEGADELSAFHKRTGFAADRVRRLHVGRRQRSAQAARREGGACATPNWPPPNGISTGCARAGPRRSRPPRCISTCCATCGASTRTSVRSPIRCSMPRANWPPVAAAESQPARAARGTAPSTPR